MTIVQWSVPAAFFQNCSDIDTHEVLKLELVLSVECGPVPGEAARLQLSAFRGQISNKGSPHVFNPVAWVRRLFKIFGFDLILVPN